MSRDYYNKLIGAHVSAEPDVSFSPGYAHEIGAKAFALFTAPSEMWKVADLPTELCEVFKAKCAEYGFGPETILPHAGFMMNLGSPDSRKLAMSRKMFVNELHRCELLGLTMLNFHPGASLKQIEDEECLERIAESINYGLSRTGGVTAVIENTAGQGSNMGWSFGQIGYIIERVEDKSRVGVCVDTCHAYAAGYDLATAEGYDAAWAEFDRVIGRQYLCAMHLNDAARPRGSRIDRHASLSKGMIGHEAFGRLIADSRTDNIPLILETPDENLWPEEIASLYGAKLQL